jgi:aminoglycoside phosphotransferase family enzyme
MTNNAYTWTDNFSELVEKYAEQIMDSMDMKTMEQFVFDTLVENLNNYSESELINEIRECYGDEMLESFGVELKEGPDDVTV